MKATHLFSFLLLLAIPAFAGPEDRTANAVKALAETLIGKEVSVETTHISPVRSVGTDDVSVYVAHTYDTSADIPAGTIMVAVLKEDIEKFVKKFGTTPEIEGDRPLRDRDTTRLTGVLQETEKHLPYIDMTDGKASAELMAKVGNGGSTKPSLPERGKPNKPKGKPGPVKKK